jgi:hypothetical protein
MSRWWNLSEDVEGGNASCKDPAGGRQARSELKPSGATINRARQVVSSGTEFTKGRQGSQRPPKIAKVFKGRQGPSRAGKRPKATQATGLPSPRISR